MQPKHVGVFKEGGDGDEEERKGGLTGTMVCRPSRKDQIGVRQANRASERGKGEIGFRPNESFGSTYPRQGRNGRPRVR